MISQVQVKMLSFLLVDSMSVITDLNQIKDKEKDKDKEMYAGLR